ncbi:hypothetical protein [Thermosulfurimonas dismutans]|nr:hypothetical protein [Thermosulfurimonas dismutans]
MPVIVWSCGLILIQTETLGILFFGAAFKAEVFKNKIAKIIPKNEILFIN